MGSPYDRFQDDDNYVNPNEDALSTAYEDGKRDGHDEGYNEGYDDGFAAGQEDEHSKVSELENELIDVGETLADVQDGKVKNGTDSK